MNREREDNVHLTRPRFGRETVGKMRIIQFQQEWKDKEIALMPKTYFGL